MSTFLLRNYTYSRLLQKIPATMRGKARLARLLLGSSLDAQDVYIFVQDKTVFLVPSLRETIAFHLLIDGFYEFEVSELLRKHLRPGDVVVDVGANIGSFAVPAAQQVGLTGRVIAIEASPVVLPYLQKNLQLNQLTQAEIVSCAVAEQDDLEVPFYIPPPQHFGCGSLYVPVDGTTVQVKMRRLDTILAEQAIGTVAVLKIDVEGSELAVLRGATHLLQNANPPLILFEFYVEPQRNLSLEMITASQHLLRQYGYQIWRLKEYLAGKSALIEPLTSGFELLVAVHG